MWNRSGTIRYWRAIAVATIMVGSVLPARAEEGRCLIIIDRQTYLKGRCEITIRTGGSFTVGVGDTSSSKHFAYVSIGDTANRNEARGTWNGVAASSHAGEELGTLKRAGACWHNSRARICAWKDAPRKY